MKKLTAILLFTLSICSAQNQAEENARKISGKWLFEQFEQVKRSEEKTIITNTIYADSVFFIFNEDNTLDVIYSELKREKYEWKMRRGQLQILAKKDQDHNGKIVDSFDLAFQKDGLAVFLERIGKKHNGITLKRIELLTE